MQDLVDGKCPDIDVAADQIVNSEVRENTDRSGNPIEESEEEDDDESAAVGRTVVLTGVFVAMGIAMSLL